MEAGEIMSMLSSDDGEVVFLATEILLGRDDIILDKDALLKVLHPRGNAPVRLYRAFNDINLAKIQCMIVLDKFGIEWDRKQDPQDPPEKKKSSSQKSKRKLSSE